MSFQFDDTGKLKRMTDEEVADLDKDSSVIVCNKGKLEDSSPYWAYIAVIPSKCREFMNATEAHTPIKLGDYGKLLNWGFEEEVPSDIKKEMQQKYGCDDSYMEHLTCKVKKAQGVFMKDQANKRISDIVAMLKHKPQVD